MVVRLHPSLYHGQLSDGRDALSGDHQAAFPTLLLAAAASPEQGPSVWFTHLKLSHSPGTQPGIWGL